MEHERDVSAVSVRRHSYADSPALVVEWDFAVRGGSFGEHEADVFVAACAEAVDTDTPVVTILRSGGTRLQEGMRALVGIPRASLALADVRAARLPHLAVVASPTTGGVWVALRGGDDSVGAWVGLLAGRSVVLVAAGADRAGRATPAGYHLLRRAAGLAGHLGQSLVTLVDTAGADPLPDSENAGVAASIAGALTDVLACPSATVAVVRGEGGSGGALAAAVCDVVAVTAGGWFAALSPEGAGAALRRGPDDVAALMRISPAELRADGF